MSCTQTIFMFFAAFILMVSACSSEPATTPSTPSSGSPYENLPVGDAANGERLFMETVGGAPTCITCHSIDGTRLVGPTIQGYGAIAAERVAGQSAGDYTLTSITRPSAHIVTGYSNAMYAQYSRAFDEQQLADVIAFLLSQ